MTGVEPIAYTGTDRQLYVLGALDGEPRRLTDDRDATHTWPTWARARRARRHAPSAGGAGRASERRAVGRSDAGQPRPDGRAARAVDGARRRAGLHGLGARRRPPGDAGSGGERPPPAGGRPTAGLAREPSCPARRCTGAGPGTDAHWWFTSADTIATAKVRACSFCASTRMTPARRSPIGRWGSARRPASPVGQRVAYARDAAGQRSLVVTDLSSGREQPLAVVGDEPAFVWAPDGGRLAVGGTRADSGLYDEVTVLDARDGHQSGNRQRRARVFLDARRRGADLRLPDPVGEGLAWERIDVADGRAARLATFTPTQELALLLGHFDQYAQSVCLYSREEPWLLFSKPATKRGTTATARSTRSFGWRAAMPRRRCGGWPAAASGSSRHERRRPGRPAGAGARRPPARAARGDVSRRFRRRRRQGDGPPRRPAATTAGGAAGARARPQQTRPGAGPQDGRRGAPPSTGWSTPPTSSSSASAPARPRGSARTTPRWPRANHGWSTAPCRATVRAVPTATSRGTT